MDRNYPEGADLYQQIIHVTRYAKYRPDLQRREYWSETVDRYADFMESMVHERTPYRMTNLEVSNLREAIWNFRVMPSMRAVMTAGPAADKDNMAIYNCSYAPIKDHRVFSELLYILMCGTGAGFSVERQYVNQLPTIPDVLAFEPGEWVVEDSKVGWAESLQHLLDMLYAGKIPKFDYSMVRLKGAILKTFGGRASGPDPLKDLHRFIIAIFTHATGRKLNSLECHDIACKIGEVVVSGGVRRSALISLSNLSDDRMRDAKKGNFGQHSPYRYMANNSSALTEIPEMGRFISEWHALYESKSGERGFFNRVAAKHRIAGLGTRDPNHDFGTNPCGEILLRPFGLCNLSEIVVRPHYTLEDMRALAHQATMLGTIQSLMTDFRYVRDDWRRNAEEERLLGVSLTGLADHPILGIRSPQTVQWLTTMRLQTRETNNKYADLFGINRSAAITTIKPSGTVSQLVDSASGVHRQFAPRYIRRIRGDMNDPTTKLLIDAGVPWEPDSAFGNNAVFSFVKRAPNQDRRTFRDNESAVEFMEYVKMFGDYWTDHNPSVTVNVKDHEWLEVGAWVYKNLESVCGMSFLPYDGGSYVQAPYEETDEAELIKIEAAMPKSIDWSRLPSFGDGDEFVTATKELACVAGVCEVTSFGNSAA